MSDPNYGADLTNAQFKKISKLVYDLAGITLPDGKKQLVKARLNSRLRNLNLKSFDQYLEFLSRDSGGNELVTMLDSISTNLTSFFREGHHFKYLQKDVMPQIVSRKADKKKVRIWSAGCSSGEEPYTIAMTLRETVPNPHGWDMRILATDLSTRVLGKAAEGVYQQKSLSDIPKALCYKYFDQVKQGGEKAFRAKSELKKMITFSRLNLMEGWPMKGPFDVIFCRNVMIYFDKETQNNLVNRYHNLLRPGGVLFLGHSESLTRTSSPMKYIEPTIYKRPA